MLDENGQGRDALRVRLQADASLTARLGEVAAYADSAGRAQRLETARSIGLSGDAAGSTTFDGTKDVNIYASVEAISNAELEELFKQ